MNTEQAIEIRELTQEEISTVEGGFFFWVHIARTAAVIVALGVTALREACND